MTMPSEAENWSRFYILVTYTGLIFNFASNATKKISNSVAETAHTIKKSVEEGNIDGIFDKVHGHTKPSWILFDKEGVLVLASVAM